jgi:hypothetical protein
MATLAGQRAQFTWALNQYNLSEDPETRAKFAKRMAKYIAAAPANGFTVDEVTQGQIYPSSEVDQYINDPSVNDDPGITEEQAIRTVEETVDTSDVIRTGEGAGVVYAYGYRCCEDRLKVGFTEANTVSGLLRKLVPVLPISPSFSLRSRQSNAVLLSGRFRRPWRHGAVRFRGPAPNGSRQAGMRFWRSINLSSRAAALKDASRRQCHSSCGRRLE